MEEKILNYKTYGAKSNLSLLIIHGLFGSLDNWMSLAKQWSESFYVIAIDVRNHGRSFHDEDMSFETINQDILAILNHEEVNQSHILGHSMGGKIAMDFAYHFPEFVSSLIVADVAPYKYQPHHQDVFEMIDNIDLSICEKREDIDIQIRKYINKESIIQFMNKNITRSEDTMKFEWKFNYPVLKSNYAYLIERLPLGKFEGKTLFIGGELSDYLSKETSENIPDYFSNYELEFVSNAGHWLHADNPTEFYTFVSNFLITNP